MPAPAQNINASLSAGYAVTESLAYGFSSQNVPMQLLPVFSFTNGNGVASPNLVDDHFEKTITLNSGASVTLTLSALTDDLGRSVAFAAVAALILYPTVRTAGDKLTVGGAAANPWTAIASGTVPVFGLLFMVADGVDGFAVSAGASDQLKITNSGANQITFKLGIVGRSA